VTAVPGRGPAPAPAGRLLRLGRRVAANARAHPYLTVMFGFWSFGYTMMVPTLLGSHFMAFFSEQFGGRPEALFLAFGLLLVNVILFAFVVPFVLWMMVCWALGQGDDAGPDAGSGGAATQQTDRTGSDRAESTRNPPVPIDSTPPPPQ